MKEEILPIFIFLFLVFNIPLANSVEDVYYKDHCFRTGCEEPGFCKPFTGRCECDHGMVYRTTEPETGGPSSACVQPAGKSCRTEICKFWKCKRKLFPCTPNSYCNDGGICTCNENYFRTTDGQCLKSGINGLCRSDLDCGNDEISGARLICQNGKCTCDSSHSIYAKVDRHGVDHLDKNFATLCAPLATKNCSQGFCSPGSRCSARFQDTSHDNPYHDGTNWVESATCECTGLLKRNPRTSHCSSPYNHTCNNGIPCMDGFVCNDGVCKCMIGQLYNRFENRCISRANSSCDENVACVTNAICRNKVCQCNVGYVPSSTGECVGEFGARCRTQAGCDIYRNLMCSKGTCACRPGLKMSLKTGECSAGHGGSCSDSVPCMDRFTCNNGTCSCREGQYFKRGQCISYAGYGCHDNSDCPSEAYCHNSSQICKCKKGYPQNTGGTCGAAYGRFCTWDSHCDQSENQLICSTIKGVCECSPGLKMSLTTGLCSLPYNASCLHWPAPCGDDLVCITGVCECSRGMYFDMEFGRCKVSAGQVCKLRSDCGTNSNCRDDQCACDPGYVPSPSGRCDADFGTCCREDADCAQTRNKLVCKGGKCSCDSGRKMSPTTGRCSLEYGEPCNGTIPCFDDLECKGMCSCSEGQNWQDDHCLDRAGNCSNNSVYVAEERACLGYVGNECDPRFTSLLADSNSRQFSEAGNCLPNAVCRRRTNSSSTPVYECLCDGPEFVEAANHTCIRSSDFPEDNESQQYEYEDPSSSTAPSSEPPKTTSVAATSAASSEEPPKSTSVAATSAASSEEPPKSTSVAATSAVPSIAPSTSTTTTTTEAPRWDTVEYEDLQFEQFV